VGVWEPATLLSLSAKSYKKLHKKGF